MFFECAKLENSTEIVAKQTSFSSISNPTIVYVRPRNLLMSMLNVYAYRYKKLPHFKFYICWHDWIPIYICVVYVGELKIILASTKQRHILLNMCRSIIGVSVMDIIVENGINATGSNSRPFLSLAFTEILF